MDRQRIQTRIANRFDVEERELERVLTEDPTFRTLCWEYVMCAKALIHWRDSDTEVASARGAEYSAMLDELTAEIETRLSALRRS